MPAARHLIIASPWDAREYHANRVGLVVAHNSLRWPAVEPIGQFLNRGHVTRSGLLQMSAGDRAQTLEVLSGGGNLHPQRIAIRFFFKRARPFTGRISALSWLPDHLLISIHLVE